MTSSVKKDCAGCTERSLRRNSCQHCVSSRSGTARRHAQALSWRLADPNVMSTDTADFIEVYDDAIDSATCAALIDRFEKSGSAMPGKAGSGVDAAVKNSWDITI